MQQVPFLKKSLLFLIPFILFLALLYNVKETKLASIRTVDPEYIHLISSVNLASGQYKLLSIESPATSLYIYGAMVVKITHWLTGNNVSLMDDFLLNPEKYILSFRISLIIATLLSLLCLGFFVYKYTGNLILSFFLQLCPFVSLEILNLTTIICPESFLIIIMIWYIILLLLLRKEAVSEIKIVIYFSIIAAIGLATKMTFIPLIIIPLLLFSKNKYRLYYLLITVFLALVIAFPAVIQHERFISWVNGLIFHAGNYGKGAAKIVDINLFEENLKKIFSTEIFFSIAYLFSIFTVIYLFFIKKKKDKTFLFFLAIAIVFTFQIALTAKHFAFRYLIPSMMLTTYVIYESGATYHLYYKSFSAKGIKILSYTILAIILGFGLTSLIRHNIKYKFHRESRMDAYHFIKENLYEKPILIIPNYFGSSTLAYSIYFSAGWTGEYRDLYFGRLNQLYPDTYFYVPFIGKYQKWNYDISLPDILTKYKEFYVYGALDATDAKEEDFNQKIKNRINYYNSFGQTTIGIKRIYQSAYDVVYKLSIDQDKLHHLYHYEEIKCDMENLSKDSTCFETNTKYKFNYNNNRSNSTAFSGKYCQFLDQGHPWGSGIILENVKPGNHYEVTLWKKSSDKNCFIVATIENSNDFYIACNYVNQVKNGWEQLKLTFEADKKIENKQVHIYIWYNGKDHAFIDDFQITIGTLPAPNEIPAF